jgi:mRNA-degrading endonuclease RelE of RelBE toxin-antitoxin system
MYEILYAKGIKDDFKPIPAYNREEILDKIERQLKEEPGRKTRNKKILEGLRAPWKVKGPLWELRVGEFRVF